MGQHPDEDEGAGASRDLTMARTAGSGLAESEGQRAIAEVQAAILLAKRFPRNEAKATDRIMQACTRPALADQSQYTYSRGGTEVTGPSIRLAEAIAQNWGNLQFGIKELSQSAGESTVEAFAWDMETNTKQQKIFQVPHERHTKNGVKKLTDPRDIYETVANNGARRLRACILGIVPGDVVESAIEQCELTMRSKGGAPEEQIKKLIEGFAEIGVTPDMLTAKVRHKLDTVNLAEVARLRRVFRALKDGYTSVEAEFPITTQAPQSTDGSTTAATDAHQQSGSKKAPAATAKISAGLVKTLQNSLKAREIPESEFCMHFGIKTVEELLTSKMDAATQWISKYGEGA